MVGFAKTTSTVSAPGGWIKTLRTGEPPLGLRAFRRQMKARRNQKKDDAFTLHLNAQKAVEASIFFGHHTHICTESGNLP
jgi:hypothetical protein